MLDYICWVAKFQYDLFISDFNLFKIHQIKIIELEKFDFMSIIHEERYIES